MNWTEIIVALIAAGLLKYLIDLGKWLRGRRRASSVQGRQSATITTVDQSLAVVARARDELESDNALLRAMLAEERASSASRESDLIARHNQERSVWATEKAALKAEIADLERRLRELLAEVESLRRRAS